VSYLLDIIFLIGFVQSGITGTAFYDPAGLYL